MEGKICTKCDTYKPLNAFCKHPKGLYGHASQCKQCDKIYRLLPEVVERNKERWQHYQRPPRKKYLEKQYAWVRKQREELTDSYIIMRIRNAYKIPARIIKANPILIKVFRAKLMLDNTLPDEMPIIPKEIKPKNVKINKERIILSIEEREARQKESHRKSSLKRYYKYDHVRKAIHSNAKKDRDSLSDGYCRIVIRKLTGLSNNDITQQMIEEKRNQILSKRLNKKR